MRSRTARHPNGDVYLVSLRWMPWRPHVRRGPASGLRAAEAIGGPSDIDPVGCLFWIALVVGIIVLAPLLSLVLEFVVVLALLLPLSILASVVGLRRFEVEVEPSGTKGEGVYVTQARGVPAARSEVRRLTEAISLGWNPRLGPPDAALESAVTIRS
ncbi:MAG: hypothetical protein JWN72_241 [Thermoleophilia bacterium]|nr:hypothetical protein [Thermoleophilia bacterium]